MQEIWKDIKNYEGCYQVSNLGRVRSLNYKQTKQIKELSYRVNHKGYIDVHLSKNGKSKRIVIHRLVAQTFIPNPNALPQINHIDGNKQNNNTTNLEWCNNSENQKHAYKKGLQLKKIGVNNPNHKKLNQYDLQGNYIKTWDYIKQASDSFNIPHSNIINCCRKTYKTAGGFIWRYADN